MNSGSSNLRVLTCEKISTSATRTQWNVIFLEKDPCSNSIESISSTNSALKTKKYFENHFQQLSEKKIYLGKNALFVIKKLSHIAK